MSLHQQSPSPVQTATWGIVCAMSIESQAVLKIMKLPLRLSAPQGTAWEGNIQGRKTYLFQCGIGSKSPSQVLATLLELFPVERLLVCGLSGALHPELKTGETFWCKQVSSQTTGEVLNCDWEIETLKTGKTNLIPEAPLLLTCSVPLLDPQAKQSAAQTTGACLVDMESFSLVKLAQEQRLPVGVLRSVCDEFQTVLPAEVSELLDSNGNLNGKSLFLCLLKRPTLIVKLISMQKQSGIALKSLTDSLRLLFDVSITKQHQTE